MNVEATAKGLRRYPPAEEGIAPYYPDTPAEADGFQFDFRKLLFIIRRNLMLIVSVIVAALITGFIATLLITPRYTATARIQINQEAARIIESADVEPTAGYQDADRFLQTQVDVLRSRATATRVAESLNLFGNPRFFEAMGVPAPEGGGAAAQRAAREAVLGLLSENFEVDLPRDSRIATLSFESPDPRLAAEIVNAYALEFIQGNLQRKFDSSSYARTFLSKQLADAKVRLEASERALNDYARQAGLIRTESAGPNGEGGGESQSVTTASLVQLNQAANEATAARIATEQKWRAIADTPALSIPEVLQNTAVQSLLTQRAQLTADLERERARHLESYPTVRQLRAQLNEINAQIETVAASIRQSLRDEYQAALTREQALLAKVNQFKSATLAEQDRSVRYNILAREADTNRTLYDGLLQRYKELSAAAGLSTNNISIIDQAEPPLAPSSPKLMLNLALALAAGIGIAALLVFIREQLDDKIRVPEDLEHKLEIPVLGLIPAEEVEDIRDALANPRSPISEAYSAMRTAILYSSSRGMPRMLVVTSSQAGEGKSTTSFATAASMARLGKRVVLVDMDLRRPSLHRVLEVPNEQGVTDLLTSDLPLKSAIKETGIDNLSFICCGPIPPNPSELLGSVRTQELLSELREYYDVIILDGPPVLGLADAPMLASIADGTIFVVESNRGHWGGTKAALRRLRAVHANVLGGVLTKYDARKVGSTSYYGYGYDYDYYQYGTAAEPKKSRWFARAEG